jgi:hypothetical protein
MPFRKTTMGAVILSLFLGTRLPGGTILSGDINNDGSVDITDVLNLFMWLSSTEVDAICQNAADVNRDGRVDLTDAIALLAHMYGSELGAPAPLPEDLVASCQNDSSVLGLKDVQSFVLTPESVMVTWLSALPSNSIVRHGASGALHSAVEVDESVTYHQVLLNDLQPGATYYYQVESAVPGQEAEHSFIDSFRTSEISDYEIRPDHPRIFFTSDDIPEIRKRIENSRYEKYWEMSERYCDNNVDMPPEELVELDNFEDRVKAFAFVGLIGDESGHRKKAIEVALHLAEFGTQTDEVRGVTEAIAFVYDWLYEYMDSDDREKLLRALVRQCRDLQSRIHDDEYVTGTSHGHNKSLMLAVLAFHGDHSYAEDLIDKIVWDYRYGFLATWRRFSAGDGGSSKGWWYTNFVLPFELEFLAAWRSATGQDWYQEERVWCEPLLDWLIYGLQGDLTFLHESDSSVFKGLTSDNRLYANMVATEYKNPVARWLADRAEEMDVVWGPFGIREILWHDASIEPALPSGPTSKIFRSAGTAIMKESLVPGGAMALFRSPEVYTQGHSHRDSCTFTIFYKTALALDSGIYDEFSSAHHDNYYSRTVAHNAITVFDPNEEFTKYGIEHANDGGQRWLMPGEDVENAWPPFADDTVDRSKGYRLGGITRYEDGAGYTYAVGDGTPAYSPKKLVELKRHFLWLNSVEDWKHPVVIVFDDVVSRRASFRKAYLLHTANEPEIDGARVRAENGDGALYQYTLVPEEHEITAIGGPGKEFWVDGDNYPPARGPRPKEEPGAWRIEVSPSDESTSDRFLHALYVADEDEEAPSEPEAFTAGSMQGCRVGEWVILFDTEDLVSEIEYESPRPETHHLICGLVPLVFYDVFVDGNLQGSVKASFSGTLRFDVEGAGQVSVRRTRTE